MTLNGDRCSRCGEDNRLCDCLVEPEWKVATQGGGTILYNRLTGERRRVYNLRADAQAEADRLNTSEGPS